jgi:Zn-dependent peptidase ImmA (M78 family)/DNA-binding XRE family transcriptional regulator
MPPSVRANVKAEILAWARDTAGYQLEEAAQKLGIKPERLLMWESGEGNPTINQLRKMAKVYKRPVAVFFLQEKPQGFQVMRDLRRLPGDGMRLFSPQLTLEMRSAQERRELMLDLYAELDEAPPSFTFAATLDENPEALGLRVRDYLGITAELQSRWRDPRVAFRAWRERMEAVGVLVLQMAKVETDAVSGFAISHEKLPVVAVNKKDRFPRRVFSLLHEYAHLALRASGVSDLDIDAARPPEDQRIEVFCNAAAAAALMPRDLILSEQIIAAHPATRRDWDEADIVELALRYSVSREAVVRRLLTFGRTSERFYRQKRAQYAEEYRRRQEKERERLQDQEFRRNPARDAVAINGEPFARLVLNNYYQDRITLSDVSSFLGIRVRHLPKVEQALGLG